MNEAWSLQTAWDEGYKAGKRDAAPRWVRCEDEMPKDEGRYFISVNYKGKWLYNVAWYVKDIGDILGIPSDGTGGFANNSTEVCPDYWMMPEPPREENNA